MPISNVMTEHRKELEHTNADEERMGKTRVLAEGVWKSKQKKSWG